jgi:hypothetical protein
MFLFAFPLIFLNFLPSSLHVYTNLPISLLLI